MEYKMDNKIRKVRETERSVFFLSAGNADKQAGSNHLSITAKSEDWRVDGQTIRMSLREAKVLQRFLNDTLDE
jgi:hypothetical protein